MYPCTIALTDWTEVNTVVARHTGMSANLENRELLNPLERVMGTIDSMEMNRTFIDGSPATTLRVSLLV